MMQVEEKPDVTYSDIGGCKEQIEKLREVVETPLLSVRLTPLVILVGANSRFSPNVLSTSESTPQRESFFLDLQERERRSVLVLSPIERMLPLFV